MIWANGMYQRMGDVAYLAIIEINGRMEFKRIVILLNSLSKGYSHARDDIF